MNNLVVVIQCLIVWMYCESCRQQPGPSSRNQYDLPVQDSEQDDGKAYKVHAVAL